MTPLSAEARQAESAVHTVIESLIESQEGLVTVGERVKDRLLKRFFFAESLKRAEFRGELESVLNREGVSLREAGPMPGRIVRRVWAGVKFKLRCGDRSLLATAEEGEGATTEVYDRAIKAYLPQPLRQVLATQAEHIHMSRDFVKAVRERAN